MVNHVKSNELKSQISRKWKDNLMAQVVILYQAEKAKPAGGKPASLCAQRKSKNGRPRGTVQDLARGSLDGTSLRCLPWRELFLSQRCPILLRIARKRKRVMRKRREMVKKARSVIAAEHMPN